MRALVTGAAGFVGQWLSRALRDAGWQVTGASIGANVTAAPESDGIAMMSADLRSMVDVRRVLDASTPDVIFHLAGVTFVPGATSDPGLATDVNVGAAARLLAEVRTRRDAGTLDPVVVIIGSGEQYGRHDASQQPLMETAAQRPLNVYAATKAAQEIMSLQAWRGGVRVVLTRSFNHSGAGQARHFLLPALVDRALLARATGMRTLPVGNVAPIRDYLHVSDVVRAYMLLAQHGTAGEAYNVCSGSGVAVGDLIRLVLERTGVAAETQTDPSLVRSVEISALVGDNSKLRAATGWAPLQSVEQAIDDLIHAAT